MTEDIQSLMEEAPGGDNHGRTTDSYTTADGAPRVVRRPNDLKLAQLDQRGFESGDSRFGVVTGLEEGGVFAHRGVLAPGEYVDFFLLREQVEAELGFTYETIASSYKNGRPSAQSRQHRADIDARLLALSRAGGNMAEFASAVGLSEKTVDRALARARKFEVVPIVRRPAVRTDRVCFKCGERGSVPRKRRFSKSPRNDAKLGDTVGTVDLCAICYSAGFEDKPGNPAYWQFRDDKRVSTIDPGRSAARVARLLAVGA